MSTKEYLPTLQKLKWLQIGFKTTMKQTAPRLKKKRMKIMTWMLTIEQEIEIETLASQKAWMNELKQ